MRKKVVIVGAGPGGYSAAIRAAQRGASVTVVDRDNIGGICLNWGCVPTKTLKATAELFSAMKRAGEFGITVEGNIRVDMQKVLARKDTVVRTCTEGIKDLFDRYEIGYIRGEGKISDEHTIEVTDTEGKITRLPWDRLILAMGTAPQELSALPFDNKWILSTNEGVNLREIPESILIVGGGVNGCELASILAALGSKVTLVETLSRLLPIRSVDEDTSAVLLREMKKRNITVLLDRTVEKAVVKEGKVRVTIVPSGRGDHEPVNLCADKVLVAAGRRPLTSGMGLEKLNIGIDAGGWIPVNGRMETGVPGVYAVGDIRGPSHPMLAHVASAEGIAAAENSLGSDMTMDYRAVPLTLYTDPEVASVGLSEKEAVEQGYKARSETFLFRTLAKAQAIGEISGQVKIVFEESGKVLGFHAIGPNVTDLIAEGVLALTMNATVKNIADTLHAHPTLSEVFSEAAHSALGFPLLKRP